MRILFLCRCIEAGADGVGDYTRALAHTLAGRGHHVAIVSVNDSVKEALADTMPAGATGATGAAEGVATLRLPRHWTWSQKQAALSAFAGDFAPDWISLQFVPWSFGVKGVLYAFPKILQHCATSCGAKVHMMFHELWLEYDFGPWKNRVTGYLQAKSIQRLLRRVEPHACHTSHAHYLERMRPLCPKIAILPLFGNIPVHTAAAPQALEQLIPSAPGSDAWGPRSDWILACLFGKITQDFDASEVLESLVQYAQRQGKKVGLLLLGRNGPHADASMAGIQRQFGDTIRQISSGPQSPAVLSALFQEVDLGIAVTPFEIVEKSSAVAAMTEHGLPVIVPHRRHAPPAGAGPEAAHETPYRLFTGKHFDWAEFLQYRPKVGPRLDDVAQRLERSLAPESAFALPRPLP